MALDYERKRIVDFASSERDRILPEIRRLGCSSSSLLPFVEIATRFFSTLDAHLASRLEQIATTIGAVSIDAASQRLSDLSKGLEAMISLIRTVAVSQSEFPRELYGLVAWFFGKCSVIAPSPQYVLSISTDLSTLELRQLLNSLFSRPITTTQRREIFPELIQEFANAPFFFIYVPASMAPITSTVDWPLIFHECVHAIEEQVGVVADLFPGLPRSWEMLQLQAQAGDLRAREALWTQELLCDFVASHVTGPAFLWRFLRRYFSLQGVFHQSFSHPTFDVRMRKLIDLMRTQGFEVQAAQAESLLNDMVKDLGGLSALPPPASLAATDTAAGSYSGKVAGFNRADFDTTLQRDLHSDSASLIGDLMNKSPVVTDPATLFTLVAFDPRAEDRIISSLLADFLRLDDIRSKFRTLELDG